MHTETLKFLKFQKKSSKNVNEIHEVYYRGKWRKILTDKACNNWKYFNYSTKKIGLNIFINSLDDRYNNLTIDFSQCPFQSSEFKEIWVLYIEHNKLLKGTELTHVSIKIIWKQLLERSDNKEKTAIWYIENTIANGWKNIVYVDPPAELLKVKNQISNIDKPLEQMPINSKSEESNKHSFEKLSKEMIEEDYKYYRINGSVKSIKSLCNQGFEILKRENRWDFISSISINEFIPEAISQIKSEYISSNPKYNLNEIDESHGAAVAQANRLALFHCFKQLKQLGIAELFTNK